MLALPAALAAAAYPLAAAAPPAAAQIAYVASAGNGRMISVDTVSGRQGSAVAVAAAGLAITPDGKTVYASSGSSVTPIDTGTETAEPAIAVGGSAIAMSPDGRTVYVVNADANSVTPINTATRLAGAAIAVNRPEGIAIAPDGRTAYVLSAHDTLTPVDLTTGTPGTPLALSHQARAIAVTPNGRLALVIESDAPVSESGGTVVQPGYLQPVNLGSFRADAPTRLTDDAVAAIAVSPDGRTAYISTYSLASAFAASGGILPFDIPSRTVGSQISLSFGSVASMAVSGDSAKVFAVVPCNDPHCVTGGVFAFDAATKAFTGYLGVSGLSPSPFGDNPTSIALAPDPNAAFTTGPAQTGSPTNFDGTGSSDSGGSVTSYTWRFGDGTPPLTTPTATVSHTYAQPGSYQVTLTTTNQGGCAATFVYTGQSASCSGSPTAATTRTITVASPPPTATTGPASARTTTRATVHGEIDAVGATVRWQFQYGTSPRYGKATPLRTLTSEHGPEAVSWTLTRLAPNTRYHYRLIFQTAAGAATSIASGYGQDMTFTTRATGLLLLGSHALALAGRAAEMPLRCASRYPCRGRLSLDTLTRTPGQLVTLACASAGIRIAAHRTTSVRLTIRPRCLSVIRGARWHRIAARLTIHLSSGQRALGGTIRLAL